MENNKKKTYIVLGVIVILIAGAVVNNENKKLEGDNNSLQSEENTELVNNFDTDNYMENKKEYSILDEKYSKDGKQNKYDLSILIEGDFISELDVKSSIDEIIDLYKSKGGDSIYISVFNNKLEAKHLGYTLGYGTYVNKKIDYKYSGKLGKDLSDKPTNEDFELVNKFYEIYSSKENNLSEEEVYKELSKQLDLTEEEISSIHKKVVFWQLK